MRLLHVSASLSRSAGGIFEIELALAHHLQMRGIDVEVFGLEDAHWELDAERWGTVPARVYKIRGPKSFGFAPDLLPQMLLSNPDLAHLHNLWTYPGIALRRWSIQSSKPYVVTPNGMLEPWALANRAWKKRVAGFAYERRMLRGAACLQANTEKEHLDFRRFGLTNPVAVIPNGVDLPSLAEGCAHPTDNPPVLLFLGRLHPKKGLVNALRAWASIQGSVKHRCDASDHWRFVIAGWDQNGHEAELKQLCGELGLSFASQAATDFVMDPHADWGGGASVVFAGAAFGEAKDALFRRASAFILPSFSEGLPMAALEAWSYGLPVVMTPECNLREGFDTSAAIRVEQTPGQEKSAVRRSPCGVESITVGLRRLIGMDNDQRRAMGLNGRRLVENQFTWTTVARQMQDVYQWILGGGAPPACVNTDAGPRGRARSKSS